MKSDWGSIWTNIIHLAICRLPTVGCANAPNRHISYELGTMTRNYQIKIYNRQTQTHHEVTVPSDRYILHSVEARGVELPFACRNGACTACAVRVTSGDLIQPEAMGLSPQLQSQGYALLCVSYARSDLAVETQDEDEVYELQFGQYFGKGKTKYGLPLDEG